MVALLDFEHSAVDGGSFFGFTVFFCTHLLTNERECDKIKKTTVEQLFNYKE